MRYRKLFSVLACFAIVLGAMADSAEARCHRWRRVKRCARHPVACAAHVAGSTVREVASAPVRAVRSHGNNNHRTCTKDGACS